MALLARYGRPVPTPVPDDASTGRRVAVLLGGLVVVAVGVACMLHSDLGVAPYDVLTTGVAHAAGIPIQAAAMVVPAAFVALGRALGASLAFGTLLCVVTVGPILGAVEPRLPDTGEPVVQAAWWVAGFALLAVGIAVTVVPRIGSGPAELVMLALHHRGRPLAPARTAVEVVCVLVGGLLGGEVGVGTLAFAVAIGPALRHLLPRLGYPSSLPPTAGAPVAP